MDLSTIDAATMKARGQYSTLNSELRRVMAAMQSSTQDACDLLRRALNDVSGNDPKDAIARLEGVEALVGYLSGYVNEIAALKDQKQAIYQAAWGSK